MTQENVAENTAADRGGHADQKDAAGRRPADQEGLAGQGAKPDQSVEHDPYYALLLENQLCFRLYVAAKEVVSRYRPYLEPLGLTYTQYVAMMALWEAGELSMKELCARLDLESSTLTPLVKKLERVGHVARSRSMRDERSTVVSVTDEGWRLREAALRVPYCTAADIAVDPALALRLKDDLDALIGQLRASGSSQASEQHQAAPRPGTSSQLQASRQARS